MNYKNFKDYLVTKFRQNEADFMVDGAVETVISMDNSASNRIEILYTPKFLSLSAFYGEFEPKHRKAIYAFIDTYNDREDRVYELRYMNDQIWIEIDESEVDDQRAIEIIENVIQYFTQESEFVKQLREIKSSAKVRSKLVHDYVLELKKRACSLESEGRHDLAMEIYDYICKLFYGYGHMELIALDYGRGKQTEYGQFPLNKEYQLECQMLAVVNDPSNIYAPVIAYSLAKSLGKIELCRYLDKIGHERGTWNAILLKGDKDYANKIATKIAKYYREGIGCIKNEVYASYYDRLAKGERQEVFRDMLVNGFDRVFSLMNGKEYYQIQSLEALDGISNDFKARYLYGNEEDAFQLPDWFVPLVNGLNATDRDVVLSTVADRMQRNMEQFTSRIQSGEVAVVVPVDENMGITIEIDDHCAYVYAPDLTELVDCDLKSKLLGIFAKLKELR